MDRRDFIKATGGLIAGAAALPAHAQDAPPGRIVYPLNRNWRFSATPSEAGRAPRFDDSAFARVTIPHANIRLPWHGFDEKDFAFVSLYRRRFKLPPGLKGR
ncbi:MAG: twin-arginine translocation signal domain-containing protein, partial [Proteobacteria bacterium]|nr:twin-arginine translocation signal domain-containing protein [Pseudomonadota bacterium]